MTALNVRVKTISRAIEEGRAVELLYKKEGADKPTPRTVDPSHMFRSQNGDLCLRGYDSYRDEIRTFRLDRIVSCRLGNEANAFVPPEGKAVVFPASYKLRFAAPQFLKDPSGYLANGWSEKPFATVLMA